MRSLSCRTLLPMSSQGEKERQRHYDKHIKKILEIEKTQNQKKILDSQSKIAENLRKTKDLNRKFRQEEEKTQRLHEDKKMINTLLEIDRKGRMKTEVQSKKQLKKTVKLETLPSKSMSKERALK